MPREVKIQFWRTENQSKIVQGCPGAAKSGPRAYQDSPKSAIWVFLEALGRILDRLGALWGPLGEVLGGLWEALASISEVS